MNAKERNRLKLIEYLGNPENEYLTRVSLATKVLGYKNPKMLYFHFTPPTDSFLT